MTEPTMRESTPREPIARIEAALARLGAEHEPPPGWEARVLAAATAKRPWPRWWLSVPVGAIAAAAAGYLFMTRGPQQFSLEVASHEGVEAEGNELAGEDVRGRGLRVSASTTGGKSHHAIRVYRNYRLLIACPGDNGCQVDDGGLRLEVGLPDRGSYRVLALTDDAPIAASSGWYFDDLGNAHRLGVTTDEKQISDQSTDAPSGS